MIELRKDFSEILKNSKLEINERHVSPMLGEYLVVSDVEIQKKHLDNGELVLTTGELRALCFMPDEQFTDSVKWRQAQVKNAAKL